MYYYIARFTWGYGSNEHQVAVALYPITVIGKDAKGNAEYKVGDSNLAVTIFDDNYTEDDLFPSIYLSDRYDKCDIEEFDDDDAAKCYFYLKYGH